jgi:hypothetical protein
MPSRDLRIVSFLGLLRQASTPQIYSVLFHDRTKTPMKRALKRLTTHRYLSVVGRRQSPEYLTGLSPYVYQLGYKGWQLLGNEGKYRPLRSVSEHTLCVGDAFTTLNAAERGGQLKVLRHAFEQPIGGAQADLYVELDTGRQEPTGFYLEIDLGTERPSRIEDKCAAYWRAYDNSTAPTFPYVLYVVPDPYRYDEMHRILRKLPENKRELFKVCLAKDLLDTVLS